MMKIFCIGLMLTVVAPLLGAANKIRGSLLSASVFDTTADETAEFLDYQRILQVGSLTIDAGDDVDDDDDDDDDNNFVHVVHWVFHNDGTNNEGDDDNDNIDVDDGTDEEVIIIFFIINGRNDNDGRGMVMVEILQMVVVLVREDVILPRIIIILIILFHLCYFLPLHIPLSNRSIILKQKWPATNDYLTFGKAEGHHIIVIV